MKKSILVVVSILMIACIVSVGIVPTFAHDQILNVVYDDCVYAVDAEGIDEMWYSLNSYDFSQHLDHNIDTIKYYFSETAKESNYSWASNTTPEIAQAVKTAVVNSMKKWDNVYFYSHGSSGNITKNKVINIVEGTALDHNLIIYPIAGESSVATFSSLNGVEIEGGSVKHNHFTQCEITIYVENFVKHITDSNPEDYYCEWGPAHEIGHVLGLVDIDVSDYCRSNSFDAAGNDINHHQELMMGYHGKTLANKNITYKDIAGVAIARGFHTDNDHKWLNAGQQSDGTYKLICSICNGVRYYSSLNGYTFNSYGQCDGEHNLIDGNMMAVASYGMKDYFKCKYCRYVASFEDLVEQQYSYSRFGIETHRCTNEVVGLEYYFTEPHTMENEMCTKCGYHIHSYTDHYEQNTDTNHLQYCRCGDFLVEAHSYTHHYEKHNAAGHYAYCSCSDRIETAHVLMRPVGGNIGGLGICKYCGASVSFGVLDSIPADYPHTEKGSYILPNGIIVLVPEDEEAYLNGTLEFRTGEIM